VAPTCPYRRVAARDRKVAISSADGGSSGSFDDGGRTPDEHGTKLWLSPLRLLDHHMRWPTKA
jgi:hypothetical protein